MRKQWVQKQKVLQKETNVLGGSVSFRTSPHKVVTGNSFFALEDVDNHVDNEATGDTDVERTQNEIYHCGGGGAPYYGWIHSCVAM